MAEWNLAEDGKSVSLDIFGGVLKVFRQAPRKDGEKGVLKGEFEAFVPADETRKAGPIKVAISMPNILTVAEAKAFAPGRLLESLRLTHPQLVKGPQVNPDEADPF